MAKTAEAPHKPFYKHLYVQVLTAIVFGVLLGHFYPQLGEQMKPLGDGFIKYDQDVNCSNHILHGRARHCQHGGYEKSRARRP